MTESKGPENQDRAADGGSKPKRRSLLDRVRPYAVGTIAIVVVFGGSALIGEHVRSTKGDKVREPSGVIGAPVVPTGPADTATPSPSATPAGPKLGLPVRPSVPVTITVYVDLRSPDSKAFADEYQATFTQLLTTGQAQIQYRLVTASDLSYGGTASKTAANAAACAQDQGRFPQFMKEIWKHQPDPTSQKLAHVNFLKDLAIKAGKIKMSTFEPCVQQGDHDGWVTKSQSTFAADKLGAVPVVEVNGKPVKNVHSTLTPQKLRTMVLNEAKRVIKVQATPSDTPALLG